METQPNKLTLLDATVSNALAAEYSFEIQQVWQHRKIWRLDTTSGSKYLKRSKLNSEDLIFIHEAVEYLYQQGFAQVPRFKLTRKGEPFIRVGAELYVLTDWYQGRELDFQVLMDLKQACGLLAKFHQAGRGFKPSCPDFRTAWLNWPNKWEIRIRELEEFRVLAQSEKDTSPFSQLYLRHFEPFYRQANRSYEQLHASPYRQVATEAANQRSFCHHDFSGRNLIRTDDGPIIMIDFDYCLQDLRIHDLINLLVRNLKHSAWQNELGRFILAQYHQIAPLTLEELQVMLVLLSWPQDFWQIGLQYYKEKLPWPPERFIKKLERKIEQRFERERFLNEFPKENGVLCWEEGK
ncbi:MAG TPA: CotS family spore coat protein [Bacillota bacterium]|nr:CotS family spore coat protein [Bacillota bacterium]